MLGIYTALSATQSASQLIYQFYPTHQGMLSSAKWHTVADNRLRQGSEWLNYFRLEG